MTKNLNPWWRGVLRFELFSPRGFLICAATLALAFAVCHVAGLREYTSILCGQAPTGSYADWWAIHLGMAYVVFYFAFVLVVPILVLAAGILAFLQRAIAMVTAREGEKRPHGA
jgi:hypothetical protein